MAGSPSISVHEWEPTVEKSRIATEGTSDGMANVLSDEVDRLVNRAIEVIALFRLGEWKGIFMIPRDLIEI
jgi:hypothetical protein